MYSQEEYLPYVLTGCIFYAFGLKWCYDYAEQQNYQIQRVREEQATRKSFLSFSVCKKVLNNHPCEGCLKLIATAVGLTGTLMGDLQDESVVSPKVVHATIYLFFAFSGLVDVLNFYFGHKISKGFVKMALAQSFFIEGFLFVWASVNASHMVNNILAGIVWLTSISIAFELIWPNTKLLTGTLTLLHGGWIAHMVRLHQIVSLVPEKVALTLSWHVAAAVMTALCIVVVTKSCRSQVSEEPPEIPIYDYCVEPPQQRRSY